MDSGKILIIDNSKKDMDSLSALLDEEGYQVCRVNTGRDGIKKLKSDVFDLIITDIAFTDIKGADLIIQLKRAAKKKTLILILSEQDDVEVIEELFQQGIDDYIVKPPRISYLIKRVESLVSGVSPN